MKRIINNIRLFTYLLLILSVIVLGCRSKTNSISQQQAAGKQLYTCPMHHQIMKDKPGSCPICGMDLVPMSGEEKAINDINLATLLKPTNSYVLSTIPVTTLQQREEATTIEALGTVAYDTRAVGSIAARVSGRIEKLYLTYTFQDVRKGQKVMDIYSPELLTSQQNLLFLLKNDPGNTAFITAAKERLLLSGVSPEQLQAIIQQQQPMLTISVYSDYSGHIHDALSMNSPGPTVSEPVTTRDLALKEGMYVQKGQTVLTVFNPHRLWAVLNIYADDQNLVKVGSPVQVVPETAPGKGFSGKINFIEPFLREGSKTVTARVWFERNTMDIPVGSQVKARITGNTIKAYWLPKEAVIALGLDKMVFKKEGDVFKAHKVTTGLVYNNKIQVIDGLDPDDAVAANAQFLMDSESFIKVNE